MPVAPDPILGQACDPRPVIRSSLGGIPLEWIEGDQIQLTPPHRPRRRSSGCLKFGLPVWYGEAPLPPPGKPTAWAKRRAMLNNRTYRPIELPISSTPSSGSSGSTRAPASCLKEEEPPLFDQCDDWDDDDDEEILRLEDLPGWAEMMDTSKMQPRHAYRPPEDSD